MTEIGSVLQFSMADLCDPEKESAGRDVDDVRSTEMDPMLTRQARQEQLDEFKRRNVYKVVPEEVDPSRSKSGRSEVG